MSPVVLLMLLQGGGEAAATHEGIGTYALVFMLLCMAAVTLLAAWCFLRILRGKAHFDPDGTGPAHSPVPGEVEKERPAR